MRSELQAKNKELKGLTNYNNILQMKATIKHISSETESLIPKLRKMEKLLRTLEVSFM